MKTVQFKPGQTDYRGLHYCELQAINKTASVKVPGGLTQVWCIDCVGVMACRWVCFSMCVCICGGSGVGVT